MSEPGQPPQDSGRLFRRRGKGETGPTLEELQAQIADNTRAAERATGLWRTAEHAASEQAAERLVAEEAATTAHRARVEADEQAAEHARQAAEALLATAGAEDQVVEKATWVAAARVVLNLDEFITRE